MSKTVSVVFWDVQHGHATYVKSPNGKHIVIDLGTGDYSGKDLTFSPLLHLKNNYGVKRLDYVIITHPHLDHIDDILNFDTMNPKVLLRPKQITNEEVMKGAREQDKPKFAKYCEINDRYNHPISAENEDNPKKPDNYGGLKILTFLPTECNHNNFNNHSIVTVLEFAGIKIVVPGDNEVCSFEELLKKQAFKTAITNADVLLAPHHGRESGYNLDFINLVNPRLTVVSDGRFCETSANARYTQKSRGWTVHKGNGTSQTRKCLTTNSDGEVFINFGFNNENKPYLYVKVS